MNADWLHRLRRGARLLFWSLLAAHLLSSTFGFLLPFLGGVRSDLIWSSLIYTLAILPALFGVFALSRRCPQDGLERPLSEALRLACGILATFEVLLNIIRTVSSFLFGRQYASELVYCFWPVGVFATVVVLIRIRQLARSLGVARLGRSFFSVTCVYVALVLADYLISGSSLEPKGRRADMLWVVMWTTLSTIVCIWVLVLIGRFGRKAGSVLAGECGRCEYDLTGNESGTCPECGRAVISLEKEDCL